MMSTFFLSPLTLPIASVPAFIALAGPDESAQEGLSGEAQMGLDTIYEADGQLRAQAREALAVIREADAPLSHLSLSPRFHPGPLRSFCYFFAAEQSTIVQTAGGSETAEVFCHKSHDLPRFIAERSPFPSQKNRFDGPKRISSAFLEAVHRGDVEDAQRILYEDVSSEKKRSSFLRQVREGQWEYHTWTQWERTPDGYRARQTISTLSVPSALYLVESSSIPTLFPPLLPTFTLEEGKTKFPLSRCTRTELWIQLARFFAVDVTTSH